MPSVQEQLGALKRRRRGIPEPKTAKNAFRDKHDTRTNVILHGPTPEELMERGVSLSEQKKAGRFIIQRLIPGLNKSGFLFDVDSMEPEFIEDWNPFIEDSRANWRYGSMLLLAGGLKTDLQRGMRNMKGDTRTLSGRLLQTIHLPWGLPTTLPFDSNGVPLKIVYPKFDISKEKGMGRAFEAGEPLLVLTAPGEDPDVMLPVIDFEGYRGEIYREHVHYRVDPTPWGILVNREWMEEAIKKFDEEASRWAQAGFIRRITGRYTAQLMPILPPPSIMEEPTDHDTSDSCTIPSDNEEVKSEKRSTKRDVEGNLKVEKKTTCDLKALCTPKVFGSFFNVEVPVGNPLQMTVSFFTKAENPTEVSNDGETTPLASDNNEDL